jgi:[acyl-carrier-protein] S-malonyltransferase
MEKLIVCFPGQGAQKPNMALDLYNYSSKVQSLFEKASDLTHLNLKKILEEADAKELSKTVIAQATIVLAEMSSLTILKEQGFDVACTAGFSLGELCAYHAAGVICEDDIFNIVKLRGTLMEKAANQVHNDPLSMAAVVGCNRDLVDSLLEDNSFDNLYIANDNSSKQVVISGFEAEIDSITPLLKEKGARRIIKLRVESAFHSPFMKLAEDEFREELKTFKFENPCIPLYCNVTGKIENDKNIIKDLAAKQITNSVNWLSIMNDINKKDMNIKIVEAGPGKVLSGLFKTENMVCSPCGTIDQILELRK